MARVTGEPSEAEAGATPPQQPLTWRDWALVVASALLAYRWLSSFGPGLLGPEYLVFFAIAWAGLLAVHILLRRLWRDSFALSFAAAACSLAVASIDTCGESSTRCVDGACWSS